MKKLYKSLKYSKYNKRHAKKLFIRNLMYIKYKKNRNSKELNLNKEDYELKSNGYKYIDMPSNFSFLSNTAAILKILNRLKKYLDIKQKTFVNLKNVLKIDNGAITILLSIMTEFKLNHIKFNGNFPKNKQTKSLLLSSGFFEYLFNSKLTTVFSEDSKFTYGIGNQIITTPGKNVVPDLVRNICTSSMDTLGKINGETNKGLYRTLIELMHNTNNHADLLTEGEKSWWLTVHHDRVNKKVEFVFMDYGVGIFNSLKNKPKDSSFFGCYEKLRNELIEKFLVGTDEKILKAIFEGKLHKTHTNQENRGKGLPGIYEAMARNQISNLCVITNNVYSNVDTEEYKLIDCNFNGTFITWEINNQSEVAKWKI